MRIFNNYLFVKMMLPLLIMTALVLPTNAADLGFGAPSIKITSPTDNATVPAGNITITVHVDDLTLSNQIGGANVDGQGHIHYFIDVPVPTTPGQPAITATGTWYQTAATSMVWTNVKPGRHMFAVELVNNDHTPLNPPKYAMINVTVSGTSASYYTTAYNTSNTIAAVPLTAQAGSGVTINLVAKNIAFNMSTITVPAGAKVTVNFDNQDSGIPHNFAVYNDSTAQTTIYKGSVITGPSKTTYTFTAPSKNGTYFFRCDVHPTQMTGQFIVQ